MPTPPLALIRAWTDTWHQAKVKHIRLDEHLATQAAQWGADQELDACCACIVNSWDDNETADLLRVYRRPKPESLKQQAITALHAVAAGANDTREQLQDFETILEALESLPSTMTARDFRKELGHSVYHDMENGDDTDTIDYSYLIKILTEFCNRLEKLEAKLNG